MAGQVAAASADSTADICGKLVSEAREVDRVLRTVSDFESGQKAAAELREHMEYMRQATEQLSRLSLGTMDEARLLEQTMRDLMHVTQGYMAVVQRLEEVNAYGAEALISVFHYYKMSAPETSMGTQTEESPLVRNYGEWCDRIDDVVYLLRRAQSPESAASIGDDLAPALLRLKQKTALVEQMKAGLSPQQLESERIPAERLLRLRTELRHEVERLRVSHFYGNESLLHQIEACARDMQH